MTNPTMIQIDKLRPFEGHPYKVLDNEEMNDLIGSIQDNGILSPLIVRPLEGTADEYEVVAGHRRLHAAIKAGMESVPALIYPIDRDTASVMVVDSNLHRDHILPSEKAFAYKLKMEAMKHQGKRTDLTSSQVATKFDAAAEIGAASNESRDQVFRYIRLTNLIPELLQMVDEGRIALTTAVEMSYLSEQNQQCLLGAIQYEDCTPSLSQACKMRKLASTCVLTEQTIYAMMAQPKPNQRETVKISADKLNGLIPSGYGAEDFILEACEHYRRYLQRQRDRDRDAR